MGKLNRVLASYSAGAGGQQKFEFRIVREGGTSPIYRLSVGFPRGLYPSSGGKPEVDQSLQNCPVLSELHSVVD